MGVVKSFFQNRRFSAKKTGIYKQSEAQKEIVNSITQLIKNFTVRESHYARKFNRHQYLLEDVLRKCITFEKRLMKE